MEGLTIGSDLLLTDPLFGPAATTSQSDSGYPVGSPCAAAGLDGFDIGFSAASVASLSHG